MATQHDLNYFLNLDAHPSKQSFSVNFDARVKNSPHTTPFFDGSKTHQQVTNVTIGKTYHINYVTCYGNVCDFTFKDDAGQDHILGSFFFEAP